MPWVTIAWGTLGRVLKVYARIPSGYHFASLRMSVDAPGDDDTVVELAGGNGDGREKQTRRRGKCGRQLPKSGWAGRTPAKRPALVAPDRHRRSSCLRAAARTVIYYAGEFGDVVRLLNLFCPTLRPQLHSFSL